MLTSAIPQWHTSLYTLSCTYTQLQVLKRSQYLLLQTASPDALFRLEHSPLAYQKEELLELYFQQQHHGSIEDFLAYHLQRNAFSKENLLMQVSSEGLYIRARSGCTLELRGFVWR